MQDQNSQTFPSSLAFGYPMEKQQFQANPLVTFPSHLNSNFPMERDFQLHQPRTHDFLETFPTSQTFPSNYLTTGFPMEKVFYEQNVQAKPITSHIHHQRLNDSFEIPMSQTFSSYLTTGFPLEKVFYEQNFQAKPITSHIHHQRMNDLLEIPMSQTFPSYLSTCFAMDKNFQVNSIRSPMQQQSIPDLFETFPTSQTFPSYRTTTFPMEKVLFEQKFQGNPMPSEMDQQRTHDFVDTFPMSNISSIPTIDIPMEEENETLEQSNSANKVIQSEISDFNDNWICERRVRGNRKQYDKYYHHKRDNVTCRSKVEIAMYESTGIHPRSAKAKFMVSKTSSKKKRSSRISKSQGSTEKGENEETIICLPFKKRRIENLDDCENNELPCVYDIRYDEKARKTIEKFMTESYNNMIEQEA